MAAGSHVGEHGWNGGGAEMCLTGVEYVAEVQPQLLGSRRLGERGGDGSSVAGAVEQEAHAGQWGKGARGMQLRDGVGMCVAYLGQTGAGEEEGEAGSGAGLRHMGHEPTGPAPEHSSRGRTLSLACATSWRPVKGPMRRYAAIPSPSEPG